MKTFAEFFAGIGLVGRALRRSGWACGYAGDIDAKKAAVFDANRHGDDPACDVRDVWDTEGVLARIGRPALATASFPCIDLSLAGHGRGLAGKHSSAVFGFTQVLERMGGDRPPLVLIENVVGFLTSRGGADFAAVAGRLAELGYRLDAFVLDARHFVPQSRPRVFLVGVADSVTSPLVVRQEASAGLNDPWLRAVYATPTLRPPALLRAMDSAPLPTGWLATPIKLPPPPAYSLASLIDQDDAQAWWSEAEVQKHYDRLSERHRRPIDALRAAAETFVGAGYRRKRHGTTMLEVRFDGLAGCLRTPRGGSAKQIVVVVDSGRLRMRWISAVEYARLQGAPDFRLLPNERQMLFGFGDAVCVPAVAWIDRCVLTPLFETCIPCPSAPTPHVPRPASP